MRVTPRNSDWANCILGTAVGEYVMGFFGGFRPHLTSPA